MEYGLTLRKLLKEENQARECHSEQSEESAGERTNSGLEPLPVRLCAKSSDSSLRSSENRGRGEPCVRPAGRPMRQEGEHKVRPYGSLALIFIICGGS